MEKSEIINTLIAKNIKLENELEECKILLADTQSTTEITTAEKSQIATNFVAALESKEYVSPDFSNIKNISLTELEAITRLALTKTTVISKLDAGKALGEVKERMTKEAFKKWHSFFFPGNSKTVIDRLIKIAEHFYGKDTMKMKMASLLLISQGNHLPRFNDIMNWVKRNKRTTHDEIEGKLKKWEDADKRAKDKIDSYNLAA